ncbi:uncharacterized protein J4E87_002105 [Alternaria ethzedia]|uniref:uncharacterized protein n=1 Tax=Alternaria ethzedia TaxID=181014 RepID=UPI0020C389C5|nr:uncharacterized protein J4E87_002105 [Alternaria ethzedia]KAI4632631.1 hypothetical protein J4E87_002105 [Alternaria ethzedia]
MKCLQSMTRRLLDARIVQLPESNPDIETFIEAELYRCLDEDLLTLRDSTLILDIQESLLQRSQGMFLWAALQIQSLCSMKTDHAIREALADLPKDLAQTFSRILHKSGASDPSLQAKILEVVLAACRPLTTEELREALSVDPGHAVWDPSKMLNDVQSALACCGCLLTVDEEESTVRVIHHSVKQYILHGLDDVKYMGFSVGRAHGTLADIIVTYLGYGVFETQLERNHAHPILAQAVPSTVMRNTVGGSSSARQLAMKLLKSKKQPAFDLSKTVAEARGHSYSEPQDGFKFFGYANTNWQNHIPYVTSRADAICELATTLIRSRYPELETTNADSDLYWSFAATTHQDTRILELLMLQSQKMKLCAQKTLVLLVRTGDKDTIKVLLNAGVDANSNRDGAPPIIVLAASNGDSIMIKFLLSFSTVDVNAGDWFGDTAVKKAVEVENEHIIKLLLSSDRIDVNVKNNIGNTVLLQAIDTGNAGIIKLLIDDDKIDVNAQSNSGSTALLKAVKYGDEKIVRLLLGIRNIDVNARDIDGKTALMHATCKRNKDMMKLLLGSKSVDVNIKDDTGRTALLDAASKGYSDVVKLMLTSKNIEVNTADNTGWTPLMYAAFHGKIEVVRLLLTSRKIDVNVKGQYHVTALTLAVSKSHQDVVELLVLSRH